MVNNIVAKSIYIVLLILITYSALRFCAYRILDYQDQEYAANYFSFMPFETVLESRRWLHGKALGCTYAIVSLDTDAPSDPPEQWIEKSTWHQTPLRFKNEIKNGRCRHLICECEKDWSPINYQLLDRVLRQPDSFYYLEGKVPPHDEIYQSTILIYSKTEGVAAEVRFGD